MPCVAGLPRAVRNRSRAPCPRGAHCTCTTTRRSSWSASASSSSTARTRVTTGNLRLSHLRIKPDALSALQLPVVLKHGYIGSLHIVIPFADLAGLAKSSLAKSTPVLKVQVHLENVFIVAGLVRKFDGQEHVKGMRKATDQAIRGANAAEEASRDLEREHTVALALLPFEL